MISYHVYLKDYKAKTKLLLGVLPERRKISRNQTPTEAGLKLAKKLYRNIISDPQAIFVSIKSVIL